MSNSPRFGAQPPVLDEYLGNKRSCSSQRLTIWSSWNSLASSIAVLFSFFRRCRSQCFAGRSFENLDMSQNDCAHQHCMSSAGAKSFRQSSTMSRRHDPSPKPAMCGSPSPCEMGFPTHRLRRSYPSLRLTAILRFPMLHAQWPSSARVVQQCL